MKILDNYKGLPRSVYVLFWVQIVNKFGEFVIPFLTLLLTEKLGFSFGQTGIIVMTASLISIPASFIGGRVADKISRKKSYMFGQTLAACCILICGFISNSSLIVVLLIASSFFNGFVRPSMSAIMADVLPPERRQAGSSLTYMGINIGVALGPLVAGFLFNNLLPLLFIGDAFTSFIAVGIFYKFIKETKPTKETLRENSFHEKHEEGSLIKVLFRRTQILVFLIINIIYSIVYTQHKFALPMMLNNIFNKNGPSVFGILMSVNALTVIFLSFFLVQVTKKFDPLINIIAAGVFYAIGFGMISFINSFPLFILSTVFWTVGEILTATNSGVFIANNSPQNFRARFSAVSNLSYALGSAIGTSIIGMYIDFAGIKAVWPLVFVLSCVAIGFMAMLYLYSIRQVEESEKLVANDL